jgi:hypothetical protein
LRDEDMKRLMQKNVKVVNNLIKQYIRFMLTY